MERKRSGRNGAVQAKRSLLSPDFYPVEALFGKSGGGGDGKHHPSA
ncbi:hypothetical protein L8C07_23185 [Paenibacillus sp. CMAA1739]|nr:MULTISPECIES: hypothetical protein [Paenibacillus]MDP1512875.1 hypothetical protein [Paenibacillus ottowii]MEC4568857.1 hypothetical protein [Paenibacillus sp. CMAA1739]